MSATCLHYAFAAVAPVLMAALAGCQSAPLMENPMPTETPVAATACCDVLELRQYTLKPGQRDVLIDLFDREFVAPQQALGIHVAGQFRDLDDPDRFVWLRGFEDMPARAEALTAFYSGPVWQAHRNAANATMLDSDNVLLLRPAASNSGFAIPPAPRSSPGDNADNAAIVVATIYYFGNRVDADFVAFFDGTIAPLLAQANCELLGRFISETAENNFPRLPVRAGESVFVWFARYDSAAAHAHQQDKLMASPAWTQAVTELQRRIVRSETLRLAPTAGSLLPLAGRVR
jgi:hypothetical protein